MDSVLRILVDGDACPVKDETYKVARRHQVPVSVVSNSYMRVPESELIQLILVKADFDGADNYIAGQAGPSTIVITADILLADRCIKAGSTVIAPNGKLFTPNSIGMAVATRAIMEDLRAGGEVSGGPRPFTKADRSSFLASLHTALTKLKQGGKT